MGGLSEIDPRVIEGVVLAIVAVAAFTDVRGGVIPNWLTLPALVLAPITYGIIAGSPGLIDSLLGLLVCSIVPLMVFYRKGMAGGDVKLFAAVGAVGGLDVGLQVQFLSLIGASFYALGQLAWSGGLLRSLWNSVLIGLNPVLPRRFRRPISEALMHRVRLGAGVLLGAVLMVAGRHPEVWV